MKIFNDSFQNSCLYQQNRKIDRQEIFKKLFKGKEINYDDMFISRGFRGMHIIPYPNHIKEQLELGLIYPGTKNKVQTFVDDFQHGSHEQSVDMNNLSIRGNDLK